MFWKINTGQEGHTSYNGLPVTIANLTSLNIIILCNQFTLVQTGLILLILEDQK